MKFGIIIETNDLEKAWNAFRFASTARKKGHEIKIFLMGEAVECEGLSNQRYNVSEQLNNFIAIGGEILACESCLKTRGKEGNNICQISTMDNCLEMIVWADKVMTF